VTHPRRVIRESVAAALVTLNTAAETRVWASQEAPVNVEAVLIEQGPVILVYTRNDRSPKHEGYSPMGQGWAKRECELHVEITAAGALVVDGKLDDIAEQVEEFMDTFIVPGQPATEIRHVETTIDTTQEFEQPIGGALLTYEACYWRPWRVADEDPFFPHQVSAAARGDAAEVVADCAECDECPPGAQP
jgi:hypothetical protein